MALREPAISRKSAIVASIVGCALFLAEAAQAENPIIKGIHTADPSAHVWADGKLWLYPSHDQDDAVDYGSMDGYHVFSTADMVNWTDHGEVLHSKQVSWAVGGSMYAPAAAYKNGTYYLYFPTMANDWHWRVGVATSSKPEGPFKDSGKFIAGTDAIDPAVFIDDDGAAYLYWGGGDKPVPDPKVARLKDNMLELAESPKIIDYGATKFGEGSYMHKRNGVYYFSYTGDGAKGVYAMGSSPYGPFVNKGAIGTYHPCAQDHHSIVEYCGQWYYFYHVGSRAANGVDCLPKYDLVRRYVSVDRLYYNADGTIKPVVGTVAGVSAVAGPCIASGGQGGAGGQAGSTGKGGGSSSGGRTNAGGAASGGGGRSGGGGGVSPSTGGRIGAGGVVAAGGNATGGTIGIGAGAGGSEPGSSGTGVANGAASSGGSTGGAVVVGAGGGSNGPQQSTRGGSGAATNSDAPPAIGSSNADSDSSGCACRASRRTERSVGGTLLLGIALSARRRRRRSPQNSA